MEKQKKMREKMKPCPFCGGNPSIWQKYFYNNQKKEWGYLVFVKCEMCRSTGKMFVADKNDEPSENDWDTHECRQAIKAWNMRKESEC